MITPSPRTVFRFAALISALIPALFVQETASARQAPPNIVLIYADDLGYGDVQCYNPERGKIPTPHIDRLAAEGMRFTDGHSSSGVCSPSRYTILTGRYHWRSKLQRGIVGLWGPPLIAAERMTIGSLAQENGYHTACIGKWHLGWDWPIPGDRAKVFKQAPKGAAEANDAHRAVWKEVFSQAIPGGPVTRGFDVYFGTDVPNWPPFCFIEQDRTVGIPSEFLPAHLLKNNQASRQGPALKEWTLEPILPALGDRAAKFIRESAPKPEPFLLYMPLTSPHTPLSVNEEWKGKSGLNLYADFVMETDAVVGQVLAAIEESGAAGETLVIFTSDNGCAHYIGMQELEEKGHYPSGPLRGSKADAWEGGHRVPFIVHWPGVVRAGSRCDQLVHQADLLATFAEILSVKLPANAGEDSFSLVPLLTGGDKPVREHAVSNSIAGTPAVRLGPWKYIPARGSGGWGKGGDQSQPLQLYNLAEDLAEARNLAADEPERLAEMKELLETLIVRGRSTPGPDQKNDVEVRRFPAKPAKNIELMKVCLWRYLDNAKNFPGYHLSADAEGCRVLRKKLSRITNKANIPLQTPDRDALGVPNNQSGRARTFSGNKLRLETSPEISEAHFEFREEGETIVLTCSKAQIQRILGGIDDIEKGEGDYSIGGDGDHVLWFWWQ